MAYLALLYDTTEQDLARDFRDLLIEFNIGQVEMMPLAASRGRTLDDKETNFLKGSSGAVFLITPGSKRLEKSYPSPSVNHELGQIKQLFSTSPEKVIYLVDAECYLPAIDQKTQIIFTRSEIRSVIAAVTMLVKELKAAGFFRAPLAPAAAKEGQKQRSINEVIERLGTSGAQIIMEISKMNDGCISDTALIKVLSEGLHLDMTSVNLTKRNLQSMGVLGYFPAANTTFSFWRISDLGWQIVETIQKKREKERKPGLFEALTQVRPAIALGSGGLLAAVRESQTKPLGPALTNPPKKDDKGSSTGT